MDLNSCGEFARGLRRESWWAALERPIERVLNWNCERRTPPRETRCALNSILKPHSTRIL
jgi:hypothetical protein